MSEQPCINDSNLIHQLQPVHQNVHVEQWVTCSGISPHLEENSYINYGYQDTTTSTTPVAVTESTKDVAVERERSRQQIQDQVNLVEWRQYVDLYGTYSDYEINNAATPSSSVSRIQLHPLQNYPPPSLLSAHSSPLQQQQQQQEHQHENQSQHQQHSLELAHHSPQQSSSKLVVRHENQVNDSVQNKRLRPHSTPATLCWLEKNYELADGICIPRNVVYFNYVDFCSKNNMQPVNAASFGKIIRQMFQTLTTRRLGTRGQSRYHYFGLAVKSDSIYYSPNYASHKTEDYSFNCDEPGKTQSSSACLIPISSSSSSSTSSMANPHSPPPLPPPPPASVYFASVQQLPEFPGISDLNLGNVDSSKLQTLIDLYRWHCQKILDAVNKLSFSEIPHFLSNFWKDLPPHFLTYLGQNIVVSLIGICDIILYRTILRVVLPSPIQAYPENVLKIIRKFSEDLINSLQYSLKGVPDNLIYVKLRLARQISKLLRRGTSVNHLYRASCIVATSPDMRKSLLEDWKIVEINKVIDDLNIKNCNYDSLKFYMDEFRRMLVEEVSISEFCKWMEGIVNLYVNNNVDPGLKIVAKNFLTVWHTIGCKIHKVLRDKISGPTSGGIQLLYLMLNEVILYNVERIIFEGALKELIPKMMNAQPSELPEFSFLESLGPDFLSKSRDLNATIPDFHPSYNLMKDGHAYSHNALKIDRGKMLQNYVWTSMEEYSVDSNFTVEHEQTRSSETK